MSLDQEKMKTIIAFKKRLEDRLEALNVETKEVQAALDMVNTMLLEKGFKRGDLKEASPPNLPKEVVLPKQEQKYEMPIDTKPAPASTATAVQDRENVFPLKTMNEEPLALICFEKEAMHILPDESKHFSANTPPFQNFLVEKVLAKMKEKDLELIRNHQLEANKAFTYDVVKEEDLIREIVIHNVDDERLKELKSSIRWTLEKMYEKMKS
ncbi:MAG: hypothetical protein ACFCUE_06765 [Candidatus Bathyarchaeia archaeon]